jgi:hypothetical protein
MGHPLISHLHERDTKCCCEEIFPVRIQGDGLDDPARREPHPTDARLTVHLVRVPRYPIKVPHRSYSDTFRGLRRSLDPTAGQGGCWIGNRLESHQQGRILVLEGRERHEALLQKLIRLALCHEHLRAGL